ncbi:phostensin [Protopterus annectens]|uniref:phostensin n=1 Tax=Protopterus annectens TaxID=7888 RepID=UPI001CFC261A|nr:phostensin [Protopterus annectens]XP_043940427.1 phostensin [Protopterus annectens]
MAGLPEWKLQLLERKRREEEDAKRKDKEQQERLANMPAWKREIIERRRAKLGTSASFSESSEPDSGTAQSPISSQLHSLSGCTVSPVGLDSSVGLTDAFSSCFEPQDSAVLQENIGPIHQNPFIKLEKQRKEAAEVEPASRVRQIADLYSQLPGVRTIRAENIIIIESDPQYFMKQEKRDEVKAKSVEALNNLISQHGKSVTEIRASEVVIIKSSLSRSVEDLNTLNKEEGYRGEVASHEGRVSKLLSKFEHEKESDRRMKPMRSWSTENILDKSLQSFGESFQNKALTRAEALRSHSNSEEHILYSGAKYDHENQTAETDRISPLSVSSSPLSCTFNDNVFSKHQPDVEAADAHKTFSDDCLPPPHTVASFRSQFEARSSETLSQEAHLLESPKKSLGYQNTTKTKPWMKESGSSFEESDQPYIEEPVKHSVRPTHVNREPVLTSSTASVVSASNVWKARDNNSLQRETSLEYVDTQALKVEKDHSSVIDQNDIVLPTFSSKPHLSQALDANAKSKRTVNATANINSKSENITSGDAHANTLNFEACEYTDKSTPNLKKAVSASTSLNNSFEIKPSPTPDMSLIADDDIQAKALANLRMQSKNSFVIIPKRQQAAPPSETVIEQKAAREVASLPEPVTVSNNSNNQASCSSSCASRESLASAVQQESSSSSLLTAKQPVTDSVSSDRKQENVAIQVAHSLLPSLALQEGLEVNDPTAEAAEDTAAMSRIYNLKPVSVQTRSTSPVPEEPRIPSVAIRSVNNALSRAEKAVAQVQPISVNSIVSEECQVGQQMPAITSDDTGLTAKGSRPQSQFRGHVRSGMVVSSSAAPAAEPVNKIVHPAMQRKGNTFTVNPRKITTPKPAVENGCPAEAVDADSTEKLEVPKVTPLKKRYPTAEEIQVIGGYLSLEKSCLAKNDSSRAKLKISFNESHLESTFEYPSETAMMEEFGPEEEADKAPPSRPAEDDDEEEVVLPVHTIPGSPMVSGARRIKQIIVDESCRR